MDQSICNITMTDKTRITTRRSLSFGAAPTLDFGQQRENCSEIMQESRIAKEEKSIHEMFGNHLVKRSPPGDQMPRLAKNIREKDSVAENLQENIKKQHQQKMLQALMGKDLRSSPQKDLVKQFYFRDATTLIPLEDSPPRKLRLQKLNSTISDQAPHQNVNKLQKAAPPTIENSRARTKTPIFRRFQSSNEAHLSRLEANDMSVTLQNNSAAENMIEKPVGATIDLDSAPILTRFKSSSFNGQEGVEKKYQLLQAMKNASSKTHHKFSANVKILSKVAKGVDVLHKVIYSNLSKKSSENPSLSNPSEEIDDDTGINCEGTSVQFVNLLKEKLAEKINSRKIENKISKTSIQEYLLNLMNLYKPLINQTMENGQEDIAVILLNLIKIHTIEFEDILASYKLNLDNSANTQRKEDTEEIKSLKRQIKEQDLKIRVEELRYRKSLNEAEKKYEQSLQECQALQNLLNEKSKQHKKSQEWENS